jgi:hypothetical protein
MRLVASDDYNDESSGWDDWYCIFDDAHSNERNAPLYMEHAVGEFPSRADAREYGSDFRYAHDGCDFGVHGAGGRQRERHGDGESCNHGCAGVARSNGGVADGHGRRRIFSEPGSSGRTIGPQMEHQRGQFAGGTHVECEYRSDFRNADIDWAIDIHR